jgi:integrase
LQLSSINRRHIAELLTEIEGSSGPVQANRCRASLSAYFNWLARRGLVEANPVQHTEKRREASRDRVLSDHELKLIWQATDDVRPFSAIVRVLMLTGLRRDEVGGLRWDEVTEAGITIPATRTKNGRPHHLPFNGGPVRAIVERQPRRGDYVFGNGRPFASWSVNKKLLDQRLAESGAASAGWTLHDLRRTFTTRLADLGIPPHTLEALLNHVSGVRGGVHSIYNRSSYTAEKGRALAIWAAHVSALVEGREQNVLAFPAA